MNSINDFYTNLPQKTQSENSFGALAINSIGLLLDDCSSIQSCDSIFESSISLISENRIEELASRLYSVSKTKSFQVRYYARYTALFSQIYEKLGTILVDKLAGQISSVLKNRTKSVKLIHANYLSEPAHFCLGANKNLNV
jgi:hypothetical protein